MHVEMRGDATVESHTLRTVARMKRENGSKVGGGNRDRFTNPAREGALNIVPRHRAVSPGVARDIAKKAGWISQDARMTDYVGIIDESGGT